MFTDAKNMLEEREAEIKTALSYLDSLKVNQAILEKASIILMIYNMIEGVFSVLINDLFDFLRQNSIDIKKKSTNLQKTICSYHLKIINKSETKLLDFYNLSNIPVPSYEEYKKQVKLFSGNLDARTIREISKMFGVVFTGHRNDEKLLYIKDIRNKLAHGEIKYSDACREKTTEDIMLYNNSAYAYIKRVISAFENI